MAQQAVTRKISLGFAVSLLLMAILVYEGLTGMTAIQDRLTEIVDDHDVKTALITKMRRAARERTVILYRMVTLDDAFERDEQYLVFNHFAAEFARARIAFLEMDLSDEEESALTAQAGLTGKAVDLQERVINLAMDDALEEAASLLNKEAIPAQDDVFSRLTLLSKVQKSAAKQAVAEAKSAYVRAWSLMLLYGALAILIGGVVSFVVVRGNVKAQANLVREKERAQITLRSIGEGVITTDSEGKITFLNSMAEEMTGWDQADAYGLDLEKVFTLVNEEGALTHANPVQDALSERRVVHFDQHSYLSRIDNKIFAIEITAAPLPEYDHTVAGAVLTFRNVTALRDMAEQMAYRASHDSLTGLINRGEFERQLEQALLSAKSRSQHHVLCYLDLDQFKVVNDTSGHRAGDELLKQLAALIHKKIRQVDAFGRLGGDEFGLLLSDCPLDKGRETVEAVLQAMREFRFVWQDKSFEVGASVGLVPVTPESGTIIDLLSAADSACYVAKDLGRNRVHIYQHDDEALATRHGEMQWFQRIPDALEKGKFILYFQKIISLDGASLHGIEILIRLSDKDSGYILPEVFLPAAERYGLMPIIDRWVIENAFLTLSELNNEDEISKVQWAINLSGQSLCDEHFLDFVTTCFEKYDIDAHQICFEITETAAVANLFRATEVMSALKERGVHFSLDDFGSGLSSFQYLRNLPVDYLKIEGSFVRDMVVDPMDGAMVESINQIGHLMELKTIAEFAENNEVLEKLKSVNVDFAQGYAIHNPEPLKSKP